MNIETCDVQVADPTYGIARCGNTALYRLTNGTDRVCGFHRDGAVRLFPDREDAFTPLESPRDAYERSMFLAAFRGPRGPLTPAERGTSQQDDNWNYNREGWW